MVRTACQSRYVKFLWRGTCVFYSHSGLLLTCQQLVPHLGRLFVLWFLFSYEYFMGHPTPPQSFQEKRVHSSIPQWSVKQQPCASILCRQLVRDQHRPRSSAPKTFLCRLINGDGVLGKEASPAMLQACCVRTGAGRAQPGIYSSRVPLRLMQETE